MSQVDIGLDAFRDYTPGSMATDIAEVFITVSDLRIERHFNVSDLLIQLTITTPASVAASVIAAQVNEYLKAKLSKTSRIQVENKEIELGDNDALVKAVEGAVARAIEQGQAK
jgi:hypothetical protein